MPSASGVSVEQIVSYALAVNGLALLAANMFAMLKRRVTIEAVSRVVVQLFKAGNIERAGRLCHAAPGTFLDAIGAAIAAIPPDIRDRTTLAAMIDESFETAGKKLSLAWRKRVQNGFLGTILVAGGVALARTGAGVGSTLTVLAGLAALGTVWIVVHKDHTERALATSRKEIVPALLDAAAASPPAAS